MNKMYKIALATLVVASLPLLIGIIKNIVFWIKSRPKLLISLESSKGKIRRHSNNEISFNKIILDVHNQSIKDDRVTEIKLKLDGARRPVIKKPLDFLIQAEDKKSKKYNFQNFLLNNDENIKREYILNALVKDKNDKCYSASRRVEIENYNE